MEWVSLVLYTIIAIASLVVYYIRNRYEYWKKRDIPHVKGSFPYGILTDVGRTVGMYELFKTVYDKYKGTGPFAGFYMFTNPSVVLLDLDLIKNVLIKDFNNFEDRGIFYNERDDPLSAHLVSLKASKWRPLRGKLTSTFTSGKMKMMFPTIVGVGQNLVAAFEKEIKINDEVEMKDLMARFTSDVIGNCAFGIECNCLKDPNVEFRKMGNKVFARGQSKNYHLLTELFPKLARFLRIKHTPDEVTKFFTKIVSDTVEYREKKNIRRNDFMDLLIGLKNKKSIRSANGDDLTMLTMNEVISQAFVFFAAGFESSSTTMGFALYELTRNPDVQEKLRREVNDTLSRYNNELTYEGIKEMSYLDQIIYETLRLYPTATQLRRKANGDYPTSDPKYTIPKNAHVMIPLFGIQRDPEFFPNPEVFDPDRFRPEEIQKRHPMAWLAFGDGPRNCIGLRFAKLQVRIGLVLLIKNFRFLMTKEMAIPLKLNKFKFFLTTEKGIVLKVEKI